eukprot:14855057-Heterocapsa_arctica.AAC.1
MDDFVLFSLPVPGSSLDLSLSSANAIRPMYRGLKVCNRVFYTNNAAASFHFNPDNTFELLVHGP